MISAAVQVSEVVLVADCSQEHGAVKLCRINLTSELAIAARGQYVHNNQGEVSFKL